MSDSQYRDPGDLPTFDLVDKNLIDIDDTYQRELDEKRVENILAWFSWKSFGALVLTPAGDGRYHCTDGQHRLAAALRHPLIDVVPAIIVQADGVAEEAAVFVGLNKERRNVTPLQLFWASHAAGEMDAATVLNISDKAGIRICRYPSSKGEYAEGDTVAVGAIAALGAKWGDRRASGILEQLAKGKLAPITSQHIKAAEALLTDNEFADIEPDMLWLAVDACRLTLDADAKAFAQTHRVPVWKAMASTWFRKARKRRKAA